MEVKYREARAALGMATQILRLAIIKEYGIEGLNSSRDGDPDCMEALEHMYTASDLLRKYAEEQQTLPFPF